MLVIKDLSVRNVSISHQHERSSINEIVRVCYNLLISICYTSFIYNDWIYPRNCPFSLDLFWVPYLWWFFRRNLNSKENPFYHMTNPEKPDRYNFGTLRQLCEKFCRNYFISYLWQPFVSLKTLPSLFNLTTGFSQTPACLWRATSNTIGRT